MIPEEIIKISESPSDRYEFKMEYPDGIFFNFNSKANTISNLNRCRELFGTHFTTRTAYVGFKFKGLNVNRINQFFERREQQLNLPPEERIQVFKTDMDDVIITKPGKFWLENSTRRGLFTLFLRAAACYYQNNFIKSLESYSLTRNIIPAILHFMEGNTVPTYKSLKPTNSTENSGFVSKFSGRDKEYLEKALIKPNTNN